MLSCPGSGWAFVLAQRSGLPPCVVVMRVVRGELVVFVGARGSAAAPFGLRGGGEAGAEGRRGPGATQGGLQGGWGGEAAWDKEMETGLGRFNVKSSCFKRKYVYGNVSSLARGQKQLCNRACF